MPVLLLSRGDPASRELLKGAITARYGLSAPTIETVRIDLKGKSRVKLPFGNPWMPVDTTLYVKFPSAIRWEFTLRPVGLPVNTTSEAFDGAALSRSRVLRGAAVNTESALLRSSRARLWTIAVMLLTPLSDPAIHVRMLDNSTLAVEHAEMGINVTLALNEDKTLNQITTTCYNPVTERDQVYSLRAADGQRMIDDLMLPCQIAVYWDDELELEMSPVKVETNPPLAEDFFRL